MNLYAYVGNDALNGSDPTGMFGGCQSCDERQMAAGVEIGASISRSPTRVDDAILAGVVVAMTLPVAIEAGAVTTIALASRGVPPVIAGSVGEGVRTAAVAGSVTAATDAASGRGPSAGRTLAAAGFGLVAGQNVGMMPQGGMAASVARAEMQAAWGGLGAAVVNGEDTTGSDLIFGSGGAVLGDMMSPASTAIDVARSEAEERAD